MSKTTQYTKERSEHQKALLKYNEDDLRTMLNKINDMLVMPLQNVYNLNTSDLKKMKADVEERLAEMTTMNRAIEDIDNRTELEKITEESMKSEITREELFNLLNDEWDSPFEHLTTDDDGTDIFAVWLDDNDNRIEPRTARGMMKRLNLLEDWDFLLNEDLMKGWADLVVDDRALIINLKK